MKTYTMWAMRNPTGTLELVRPTKSDVMADFSTLHDWDAKAWVGRKAVKVLVTEVAPKKKR